MLVNIKTDGTGSDTKVFDTKGRDLTKLVPISAIDVIIRPGKIVKADIKLEYLNYDGMASARFFLEGHPKAIAKIIFSDGTEVSF